MASARFLLTISLFLTACWDLNPASEPVADTPRPGPRNYSGDIEMIRGDTGDLFCEGQLFVTLRAGTLSGDGSCGDVLLTVSGRVTDQGVIRGQIRPSIPNTPALSSARVSGERDSDGLIIDWSLEIPMPDDPPLEDDIDMLTLDGSGWLSLD